ncbi:MAG: hypothetical protein H3C58_11125 [Fimbriimonadaceae bacterium]|nr:hypothetical protein [Fimbriimonadaceae bacterium]
MRFNATHRSPVSRQSVSSSPFPPALVAFTLVFPHPLCQTPCRSLHASGFTMAQVVIDDPILNSSYEEPGSYRLFDDDGITNEIATGRRPSSYFVPIAALKKTGAGNLFMVFGEPDITIALAGSSTTTATKC